MSTESTFKRFNGLKNTTSIGKHISKITKGNSIEIRSTFLEIIEEQQYEIELLMPIMQFGINSKDSEIVKLSYLIISNIHLTDEEGNLLPASLLLCNTLVMNLSHPNEHIVTLTLRLIGKIENYEVLSQIIQKVVACIGNDFYRIRLESINTIVKIRENFPNLVPANIQEPIATLLKNEDRGEVFITAYTALRTFNKQLWTRVSLFYFEKRWDTIGLVMKCIILKAVAENSPNFSQSHLKLIKSKIESTLLQLSQKEQSSMRYISALVEFLVNNQYGHSEENVWQKRVSFTIFNFLIEYIKGHNLGNELLQCIFGIIKKLVGLNKDIFNFHLKAIIEILDYKKEDIYFNESNVGNNYRLEEDVLKFVFSRVRASDMYIVNTYIESYISTNSFKQTPLADSILFYIEKVESYNKDKERAFKGQVLKTIKDLALYYVRLATKKITRKTELEVSNYEKFLNPSLPTKASEIEELENKQIVFIKNKHLPIIQLLELYFKLYIENVEDVKAIINHLIDVSRTDLLALVNHDLLFKCLINSNEDTIRRITENMKELLYYLDSYPYDVLKRTTMLTRTLFTAIKEHHFDDSEIIKLISLVILKLGTKNQLSDIIIKTMLKSLLSKTKGCNEGLVLIKEHESNIPLETNTKSTILTKVVASKGRLTGCNDEIIIEARAKTKGSLVSIFFTITNKSESDLIESRFDLNSASGTKDVVYKSDKSEFQLKRNSKINLDMEMVILESCANNIQLDFTAKTNRGEEISIICSPIKLERNTMFKFPGKNVQVEFNDNVILSFETCLELDNIFDAFKEEGIVSMSKIKLGPSSQINKLETIQGQFAGLFVIEQIKGNVSCEIKLPKISLVNDNSLLESLNMVLNKIYK